RAGLHAGGGAPAVDRRTARSFRRLGSPAGGSSGRGRQTYARRRRGTGEHAGPTSGTSACANTLTLAPAPADSVNPENGKGAVTHDIPSIVGRMVSMVLAKFRKSSLASDAFRLRRVDRREIFRSSSGAVSLLLMAGRPGEVPDSFGGAGLADRSGGR